MTLLEALAEIERSLDAPGEAADESSRAKLHRAQDELHERLVEWEQSVEVPDGDDVEDRMVRAVLDHQRTERARLADARARPGGPAS
jgi:hypothetical protein